MDNNTKHLKFKNISVYIGNKQILHDVSGIAEPGKLLAIMGPSGAGKTSLLNSLAGRQTIASGEITLNNSPFTKDWKRRICYVLQQDVFFETLTLRETLQFVANMRLPDSLTNEDKQKFLDGIINDLHLKKCLDTLVGGGMIPGLSGGERKRVNIACEMLTDPSFILLDEPTTGLDASTAYSLIQTLKTLAQTKNKTIVATIHQPSSKMFYLFDKLLLLCNGQMAYFGETRLVVDHFEDAGIPVPSWYNPADFIMEKMKESGDVEDKIITAGKKIKNMLSFEEETYSNDPGSPSMDGKFDFEFKAPSKTEKVKFWKKKSQKEENVHSSLMEIDKDSKLNIEETTKWPTGFFTQYTNLTIRSFKLSKGRILDKTKIIENVIICAIVSLIWFQLPRSEDTLRDRMGAVFFIGMHWGFIPMFDAVTSFPLEKIVINKERAGGWYRLSAYFLAKCTSELPLILLQPLFFVTVAYWCIGLSGVAKFFATMGTVFITALAGQSIGLFLGVVNTEMRQAITITILIQMAIMLLGGLFTRTLPLWLDWTKYLSFIHYTFHSLMYLEFKNGPAVRCSSQLNSTVFPICREANATMIPSEILLEYYGIRWNYWQYLLPLLAIIVVFRSLCYIILRYVHRPV
ncbi:uncharacterized protein LOC143083788 isoform X1 [Mytilus galloprovincialis]|uniref:uncharacterized protein LOC143083788 isoform X1 n=2 Tax=Mytilus galloprovincialis TaxID=29158 RepID=UPI003F7B8688